MGAGSLILVLVIGIIIGYFIGSEYALKTLQNPLNSQINKSLTPSQITSQAPIRRVFGSAMQISTSDSGGSATILTSSAGTEAVLNWSTSDVPDPSSFLGKLCTWTLSGTTLVSISCQ